MFHFFKKPHPFIFNHVSVILPGIVAFLFIAIFAPLGFDELSLGHRLTFALLFGGIASISVIVVVGVLKKILPSFMEEDSWTIGKEICLVFSVVAFICACVLLLFYVLGLSNEPFEILYKQVFLKTLAISLIPVGILVLVEQYNHQKTQTKQAEQLLEQVRNLFREEQAIALQEKKQLYLEEENGKIVAQVQAGDLVLFKAEGNYVEVYHRKHDGNVQRIVLRNRLKSLTSELSEGQFFNCHKSFVVNLGFIERIRGNARNLELKLSQIDFFVPVSRSKTKTLQARLKQENTRA